MTATMQLRRLFRVVNGGTPKDDPGNWGGDITWVTPDDLGKNDAVEITDSARTLTHEGVQAAATVVPSGSIVLSTRAPIGHVGIAARPLAFNQGCKALVARNNLDERFFYYQLVAKRPELEARGRGATFTELSAETLRGVRLHCPPLDEQRRIADFLDAEIARIDHLVALKQSLLASLPQRVAAVMHEAVSELPRNARLAYVASWRSGGTPPKNDRAHWSGDLPWASTKDLVQDELVETADHITEAAAIAHSCVVPQGSLLVATRGMALAKRLPLAVTRRHVAFNQDLKGLVPRPGVDPAYLRVVLRGFEPELLSNVVEAAHGTRRLETRWLKALHVPVPEARMQRSIVQRVQGVEQENAAITSSLERQLALLGERRQALINAMVTGRLGVSSDERTVVPA